MKTHPIAKGTEVTIHSATISGKPMIEGTAKIVSPIKSTENYYKVRFPGEAQAYPRFVMPEHVVKY